VPGTDLTAVYYPYTRCLDEETLKRALVLYDRLIFVDPQSPQVRANLYSVSNHNSYMPAGAAESLAASWERVAQDYALLEAEGVVEFVAPEPVLEPAENDVLITGAMQADMTDEVVAELLGTSQPLWSMLHSRVPRSAWPFLHHQYTPRVLEAAKHPAPAPMPDGFAHALVAVGRPDQHFSMPSPAALAPSPVLDTALPWTDELSDDYAVVVPFTVGSSLAVSTAISVALTSGAVPFTDSEPHFRMLSRRFARAAQAQGADQLPGLAPATTAVDAHRQSLVERRLVDAVLSAEDLAALSLEDVLAYRAATQEQRAEFRTWLRAFTRDIAGEPWSPSVDREIERALARAQAELDAHAEEMRATYRGIFRRAAIGVAVAGAPQVLNLIVPGVPLLWAFAFGAGGFSGLLAEPIKEVLDGALAGKERNGLSYLMELRKT
jgi:hypothetical protein